MMKRIVLSLAAIFSASAALFAATPPPLNVMTFNIRNSAANDGPNAWSHRKALVADVFKSKKVDIAGLQEVLHNQLVDLETSLPEYGWIGVGRDDGKEAGEYAPIFYRNDEFDVLDHGNFWISQTPDVIGSKGWDAAIVRIATWGLFQRKETGQKLFFINTHLDHIGMDARKEGAKLLLEKITQLSQGAPVILTGDFNSQPDSEAIRAILSSTSPKMLWANNICISSNRGTTNTMNGYKADKTNNIIDYIFVSPRTRVTDYKYLKIIQNGVFVSDHWPVVGQVILPAGGQ